MVETQNLNCDKTQKSKFDKTQKLKMQLTSNSQNLTKKKLKMLQLKTKIATKLISLICDKTHKLELQTLKI